jgi:hypothetical protein
VDELQLGLKIPHINIFLLSQSSNTLFERLVKPAFELFLREIGIQRVFEN